MRKFKLLLLSTLLIGVQACAGSDGMELDEHPEESFLTQFADSKADAFGLSQVETENILYIANTLSQDELDHDVALDARAARNIVSRRNIIGLFTTLEELDAVPYVGPSAFQRLRVYAAANPMPAPLSVCGDGVLDVGEECDDGDNRNADGCSATCQIETVYMGDSAPMGGFRRFMGKYYFDSTGGSGSGGRNYVEFTFVALTPVTMRMHVHDGNGGLPVAQFERRYTFATGLEPAQMEINVHSNEPGSFQEISKTSDNVVELDLPAGEYVIRKQVANIGPSIYRVYTYDYQVDFDFTGDVDTCLRPGRCDVATYHVKNSEGTLAYLNDVTSSPTRVNGQLVYPSAYTSNTATFRFPAKFSRESWPVEVGSTLKFTGRFTSDRKKYFLLRLDRPTRLDPRTQALDMSRGGGHQVSVSTKVYRHDIAGSSAGQLIGKQTSYSLEAGDYMIEVEAGRGWATTAADYTTFEVRFLQTPL